MNSTDDRRGQFLDRVRQAAAVGRSHRVDVRQVPQEVGYVGAQGDLCEALAKEVIEVGGHATIAPDWPDARQNLETLLRAYAPRLALCWQHATLDRIGLEHILQQCEVGRLHYDAMSPWDAARQRKEMLAADVGISSADWAIAETGTLVVLSKPGQERVASLLPPVHIAIIEQSQIVPDLMDVIGKLQDLGFDDLPSSVNLITGPSKTGDIELQLTTGVHGPGKWHVIIVRDGQ